MRIPEISSTDLFRGTTTAPRQVVRVTVVNEGPGMLGETDEATVRVEGPAVSTPEPKRLTELEPGERRVIDVGVTVAGPAAEGSTRAVSAVIETTTGGRYHADGEITVATPGWTMWMVSHFHYDPVWWNTQAGFTEVWYDLPAAERRRPPVIKTAFDLVRAHLDAARRDMDYKFVLAEIDYLKPHWDAYPDDRADLRRFLDEGRIELVGGNYNEANTNLTHPESTIRNAVYGIGYQRDVMGGDPRTAWMLDVFGHDPAYPGLMAQAGLDSSAWARGPFHMWGPNRHVGDNRRMQFPSEFEWLAPQGNGVLTAYMPNHYGAGWVMDEQATTLDEAMELAYTQFSELKPVAATRNVLLPVGGDHVVPSRWCTEVHRDWARRYVWPRFTVGLPRDFFAAVRAELGLVRPGRRHVGPPRPAVRGGGSARPGIRPGRRTSGAASSAMSSAAASSAGVSSAIASSAASAATGSSATAPAAASPPAALTSQTRDMNPVYTGKDVSYIDTKQAQRAAEVAVLDAERLATLAGIVDGARYPSEELDKAWRQLVFGAHHDAITGTESDQVYLDLLGGWREAYELGDEAREAALARIAAHVDTAGTGAGEDGESAADGVAIVVANTLSWARAGVTTVRLTFPAPGPAGVALRDATGAPVAAVTDGTRHHDEAAGGGLAEITLTFVARDVPALGYRVYRAVPAATVPDGWRPPGGDPEEPAGPVAAHNQAFRVTADPAAGGALTSIHDRRTDRELLAQGRLGNELVVQEEYDTHPKWNEGPWHLLPKGPGKGTGAQAADRVRLETSPIGQRIVTETALDELRITQHVTLYDGIDRVDFHTHVDGSIGHDRLLRARFGLDVPGGRPVAETGFAAIGRSFGFPDADAGPTPWTLDCPVHNWIALSATARIALTGPDGRRGHHAIGVAEVVAPPGVMGVRRLLRALARKGVTATCGRPDGPRHGALDVDSNLPDVRIALGGPAENSFTAAVLDAADPGYAAALERRGRVLVPPTRALSEMWTPDADLRGPRDLPVLIVKGTDRRDLAAAVDDLAADLDDATIEVPAAADVDAAAAAGEARETPFAGYSVALLNAGTPGAVIDVGGAVHLNLMRSCSAWPCGDWIDGDRRTAPDGSSFAWQHWSHTFRYSLVAGAGDWRDAGFVRAGHEFNHAVLARQEAPHPGDLPASASLGSVEPSTVVLTALKPYGNPLAAALPGGVDPNDGVVVRAYESTGAATRARFRLHGGLAEARPVTVLEEAREERDPHLVHLDGDAVATLDFRGADVVTVRARPHGGAHRAEGPGGRAATSAPSRRAAGDPASTRPSPAPSPAAPRRAPREPAQPVFTRYWLHNKGPAPIGNLPVAVHVSPARLALRGAEPGRVRVTVAASGRPAAGLVELACPDLLVVDAVDATGTGAGGGTAVGSGTDASDGPDAAPAPRLEYDLGPGDHVAFDLRVRARDGGAEPAVAYLAARIRDELGQILEDATAVVVAPSDGEPAAAGAEGTRAREGTREPEGAQASEGAQAPEEAEGAEGRPPLVPVEVTVSPDGLALPPGGAGEVVVRLANRTDGPVRGEAQLISPIGTWGPGHDALITPWTQGFAIGPGEVARLRYDVRIPPGGRVGAHWWALVKVACFGRLHYTSAVPIEVRPRGEEARRP